MTANRAVLVALVALYAVLGSMHEEYRLRAATTLPTSATGGRCRFCSPVAHQGRHATMDSAARCMGIDQISKKAVTKEGEA
jgi:hypothetical protein